MHAVKLDLTGEVAWQHVDCGSKSERDALVLTTDTGTTYVLRRRGGLAFGDDSFAQFAGRAVTARGVGVGTTLIVDEVQII